MADGPPSAFPFSSHGRELFAFPLCQIRDTLGTMRFPLPSLFAFLTLVAGSVFLFCYERKPIEAILIALCSIWVLLDSQREPKMPN